MGVASHHSIDELGRAIDKLRMSHDQSFDYKTSG
jgi:hypothetical protein